MKKNLLILFFIILILAPINVFADTINSFKMEATVMENGDLRVREHFVLGGTYSGFERIIRYRGLNSRPFTSDRESLEGSAIYDGDRLTVLSVGENNEYELVAPGVPSAGDSDKYTFRGDVIRMYNPSVSGKDFYIEYIIHNMAVVHEDVAELGWQIFSNEMVENIRNFEVIVNFEGEVDDLRGWAHGRVDGNIEIDNDHALLTAEFINANTPVDIRLVFNKEAVKDSNKTTNMVALDTILEIEKEWAEERNKVIRRMRIQRNLAKLSIIVGSILTIPLTYKVYKKYDKEYESGFKTDYYRDFPNDYGPEIVGYLMNKKITANEMSAALMNLIALKKVTFEEEGKNDFRLRFVSDKSKLKKSDQLLVELFFEDIKKGSVTMKDINDYSKKNAEDFFNKFNAWKDEATIEAKKYNFFYEGEEHLKYLLHSFLLLLLFGIGLYLYLTIIYLITPFVLGILFAVYVSLIKKRTKEGNEDYAKWKGLKKFITDFGNFEQRDLPKVVLWEKYLVYALVFKNAKKLARTMEIKVKEMPDQQVNISAFNTYYFTRVVSLNSSLNSSVTRAYTSASSSMASASGTGGGFSSGGGSFGGGGGGGRF